MQEELIKFETAKLAKEKGFILGIGWFGFNNKFYISEGAQIGMLCDNHRGENPVACTQSLLQKWLREVHNIIIEVMFDEKAEDGFPWLLSIYHNREEIITETHSLFGTYWDNYEEALEVGLQEALKLIKNENS